jgi:hypothetical protein
MSERLLEFDGEELRAGFGTLPFHVDHRLAGHPAFTLERLAELAGRLPKGSVEYNAGDLAPNQEYGKTPQTGLSVEETVRRIRERSSWMVLKNVERDPQYRALLDRCLDQLQPFTERAQPGMKQREGFVFISSPGAVTPFHMDPEQNFLLQVTGEKRIHQWDRQDRVVISESDIERYFAFSPQRNLPYREQYEERARTFELTAGRGLYFPSMVPHWVKNGPEPSVSFSVTFRTRATTNAVAVYRVNELLRRYGLRPRPPGRSFLADRAKVNFVRVLERVGKRDGSPG